MGSREFRENAWDSIWWKKSMGPTMSDKKEDAAGRLEEQSSRIDKENKRTE